MDGGYENQDESVISDLSPDLRDIDRELAELLKRTEIN